MNSAALRYGFFVAVFILAPLGLGQVLLGPSPSTGRSSASTSAYGHKAFYQLVQAVGFRPERFERGLDHPPSQKGVFIALEPGKLLFRNQGRYAKRLKEWVARGNAALITLGGDPDVAAERDDVEDKTVAWVGQAKRMIDALKDEAKPTPTQVDGDQPSGEDPREMPEVSRRASDTGWSEADLAAWLKSPLEVGRLNQQAHHAPCRLETALDLGKNPEIRLTRPRIFKKTDGVALLRNCGGLFVSGHRVGRGLVFLLSEPRLLHNLKIGKAAHASIGIRLVEKLAKHVQTNRVYFEEFSHGRIQARTLADLLFRGNGPWVIGNLLFAVLIWLWFRMARRRAPRRAMVSLPRSRLEMITGLARLYEMTASREEILQKLKRESISWLQNRVGRSERGDLAAAISRRTKQSVEEIQATLELPSKPSLSPTIEYARKLRELRLKL